MLAMEKTTCRQWTAWEQKKVTNCVQSEIPEWRHRRLSESSYLCQSTLSVVAVWLGLGAEPSAKKDANHERMSSHMAMHPPWPVCESLLYRECSAASHSGPRNPASWARRGSYF